MEIKDFDGVSATSLPSSYSLISFFTPTGVHLGGILPFDFGYGLRYYEGRVKGHVFTDNSSGAYWRSSLRGWVFVGICKRGLSPMSVAQIAAALKRIPESRR